ncbi:MAG: hypothetical protein P8101_15210 [Candidatus Thiodiazotropha sp.]|jgi:hypothetical protein
MFTSQGVNPILRLTILVTLRLKIGAIQPLVQVECNNYLNGPERMQDEENKTRKLSDKALERVMRDVLSGLRDASPSASNHTCCAGYDGVALTSLSENEQNGNTE